MQMPPGKIDVVMFAPCGMNCFVCYKHCLHKKPCAGCLRGDRDKPEHCRKCKIKDCVHSKGLSYCFECSAYPCVRIKALEKSYTTRYGTSLVENGRKAKKQGLETFMGCQKEQYTCPACGGVISLHDAQCSECGRMTETGNQKGKKG